MIVVVAPRLPAAPPRRWIFADGGVSTKSANVPAQVCEFLVDSLQRHGDDMWVLVDELEVDVVESWGCFSKAQ